MEGPKQESKTQSQSVNRPLTEAQPLVNSFIGGVGSLYGGGPALPSGGNMYAGPGLLAPPVTSAGVTKQAPPGMTGAIGPTGQGFNFGLTGTETGALDTLSANAARGNPYAPGIGGLATDLLAGGTDRSAMIKDRTGMVTDNLASYRAALQPFATMDTNINTDPTKDPVFAGLLDDMSGNIMDRIKSSYAGAGYSPAGVGTFGADVGEGISRGIAPTLLAAKNNLESRKMELDARKMGAINALYGAGNTSAGLLGNMDQTALADRLSMDQAALANRLSGVGVAGSALGAQDQPFMRQLEIEAQRRGIPIKNAAQLASLIVPMAQLGGTQSGTSNSTTQMQVDPMQQMLGLGLTGAGLLSGMAFPGAGMSLGGGLMAGMNGTLPSAAVFGGRNPFGGF